MKNGESQLAGVIHTIHTKEIKKGVPRQTFILKEIGVQYPNFYEITLEHDDVDDLERYKQGDAISVNVRLRGRCFDGINGILRARNVLQGYSITAY